MAGLVVVEGAVLTCPLGSPSTASLIVLSQKSETIDGMLVATIADCGSLVNVPTFGTCNLLSAQTSGAETTCIPTLVGTWTPGAASHAIDGVPALTETDIITCSYGGTIMVEDPGQTTVVTE
jgi:hypothetical protein